MPRIILSIDTTQPAGSVALWREGEVLSEAAIDAPRGFSGVIYGEINRLLTSCSVALPEVDAYAVAAGPGSFTGVRVGLAVAKGLAEMHGRAVVPVSNLLAIASLAPPFSSRCALIDVRRGEFAAALYGGDLEVEVAPFSAEPGEILARMEAFSPVLFCGAGVAHVFPGVFDTPRALAGAIARLAANLPGVDAALADAEYVRRADVRLPAPP